MRVTTAICALMLTASPAYAQHPPSHAATQKPVELVASLGAYHHPITTRNPEAQKYFDQGLTLLYGFNHDEAAKYFRRAAELDPDAAMPYWGLALSIGPNYNDAGVDEARAKATYDAVLNAQRHAPKASAAEQDYIRALAKRYASTDAKSDWKKFHQEYSEAMRELVKKYPDDLDVATMFAESLMMLRPWQLWTADGQPAPGTLELVAVLESVLRRNPEHPGANHFYVHAVEASNNLERAIPSAMRLMTLVPGAGHLVHMPGHIFLQTGDYDLAAKTNVNAAQADLDFVLRTGATGIYPLMYWTHNIHFIAYSNMQEGRYEEAKAAAEKMVTNVGDGPEQMQMLEGFVTYSLSVDLRFHHWEEILKTPQPLASRKLAVAYWHYARTMAYVGQNKMNEAAAERQKFDAARAATPAEARYMITNNAGDLLAVANATIEARMAWARGEKDASIKLWQRATELEAALRYDEPPPWFYPIRESLGAALLRNGQAVEAEGVFRKALEKRPRDGRLLFGLWQSLKAQNRASEAQLVEQEFRAAWKNATTQLRIEDL
jgi:tetratricopeptide (TPR) repeat protein